MAKKKDDEAEGGKKKNPLVLVVLCVGLAGAGYMLGGRGGGGAAAVAPTTTVEQLEGCKEGTDANVKEHKTIDLPAMNINLSDGHYLRVTVALALCPDVVVADPTKFVSAPAKDILVETLSGKSMMSLNEGEGRDKVKELLVERISDEYPEQVHDIYFLEFVMQ
jgi:flagellar basal body-associated protein FliL